MKKSIPNFLIEAFYEGRFKGNLFIVKAGGKIIEDQKSLDNLLANIHDLNMHGIKVLLIYGHGRAVDEKLIERKIEVKKINGRRVTDKATMGVIKEVVGGLLTMNIAGSMARNKLSGVSLSAVPADCMEVALRPAKPVNFGFVGDVKAVNPAPIRALFKVTNFIACSCLGILPNGEVCNINADTIATELAIGLKAHKLIFLSDVDGVLVDGKTAEMLSVKDIPKLVKRGVVTGGMHVKLDNCAAALKNGVRRIHLINGLRKDALKKEIYEPVGPGTMLILDEEREVYAREIAAQLAIDHHNKRRKKSK